MPLTAAVCSASQNSIFSLAICKFQNANASSCPEISAATSTLNLPIDLFYGSIPAVGANAVAAAVSATDGSVGYAVLAVAMDMNSDIAAMVNKAGETVVPIFESVTYAAVELGTKKLARTTLVADLTDGTGSGVWPITCMSYLLMDTVNSVSTCHAREATVNFWLWYYQSAVVVSLLDTREYGRVPDIVMTSLDVIARLQTDIQCRGAPAYQATTATTRTISVPASMSFIAGLLTPLYSASPAWTTSTVVDQLAFKELVNAEIDIGFFDPANVDATALQQARDSGEFLIIPMYLYAMSWMYNPQITAAVNIESYTLRLDVPTMSLIFFSCITVRKHGRPVLQSSTAPLLKPVSQCVIGCCLAVCAELERPCYTGTQPVAVPADRQHHGGANTARPRLWG